MPAAAPSLAPSPPWRPPGWYWRRCASPYAWPAPPSSGQGHGPRTQSCAHRRGRAALSPSSTRWLPSRAPPPPPALPPGRATQARLAHRPFSSHRLYTGLQHARSPEEHALQVTAASGREGGGGGAIGAPAGTTPTARLRHPPGHVACLVGQHLVSGTPHHDLRSAAREERSPHRGLPPRQRSVALHGDGRRPAGAFGLVPLLRLHH